MFIQAFDGSQYCCVNDKDIYALEEIPEHKTKSTRKPLDLKLTDYPFGKERNNQLLSLPTNRTSPSKKSRG